MYKKVFKKKGLQERRGHRRKRRTSEKNHTRRDECQESNGVMVNEETTVPELKKGQR